MKKELFKNITTPEFAKGFLNLHSISKKAYRAGHYIQSAIIDFQLVEFQLRLTVFIFADTIGLSASTYKTVKEEDRFVRLITYLDLLKPDNNLSDKLRKLNKDRNDFVHGLLFARLPPQGSIRN